MANRFSQNFTLKDIFNNPNLSGKIPLINYREKQREDGKISVRTSPKTITRLVYDISIKAARPFYKPLKSSKNGDVVIIDGNLSGDHNAAVDAIYNALLSQSSVMKWTVNNAEMIRSAVKEGEKNRRRYGTTSKLYLRTQSMAQIEGMSKHELYALMSDIMENIFYGDDFPETKKKFNVNEVSVSSNSNQMLTYKQRKANWKQKVGDL